MDIKLEYIFIGVIAILLIGIYIYNIYMGHKLNKIKKQLQEAADNQYRHFEEVQEVSASLEKVREELLQQKANIDKEDEVYQRYINEHKDSIKTIKKLVVTGDPLLDTVLSDKKEVAANDNIVLEYDIRGKVSLPFSEIDKVSLFGNILDNAIEAACQVELKPYIKLQIREKGDNTIITCENSKLKDITPIVNNMETTKLDKSNHGRGTKIIKNIASRYKGICTYEDKGDIFLVAIML